MKLPGALTKEGGLTSGCGAQEKLAAAVARMDELEREREDGARLARLHGRAVETQAAALRAAEASLVRKRRDVLAADRARAAAEAALAKSDAQRRADDAKVGPPRLRNPYKYVGGHA